MKAIDICRPACRGAHHHRHLRRLFSLWGNAGIIKDAYGNTCFYVTITTGDPCTWYTVSESALTE